MNFLPDLPLRHRLTLFSVLTSAVALLLTGAGFILYEHYGFRKELVNDVAATARMIGYNSASALSFNDRGSAEETLRALLAKPHVVSACIYDAEGEVFATYPQGNNAAAFEGAASGPVERFGRDRLELYRPIYLTGEIVGSIYLRTDLGEQRDRLQRYALIIGAVMMLAMSVAYGLALHLQRSISGPVVELAALAGQVGADKNYSVRAVKRGNDELGRLINGFNDMLGQIEASDLALRAANEGLEKRVDERTAALQHERDILRALLDSSPDTIYFKDAQSRFVLVSRSKVAMTLERLPDLATRRAARGLAPAASERDMLNGMTDFDTYEAGDARRAFEDEQRIIQTGTAMIGTLDKQVYLDGSLSWWLTSKMPWRTPKGEITGTFGISKDVTELKESEEKLAQLHRQLLDTSRQAGMAEVATGVLHNVGNVLNSVNVSATLVMDHVRHSKSVNIAKLSTLFQQHRENLADFLTNDPRGQMIPSYLVTLGESLATEHEEMLNELDQLRKNIEHIKDIVSMQQSYARTSGVVETVSVPDMVEDALRINAGSLARHDVDTVRDYQARPVVTTDKHKVMQILINLVRNAKYACDESGRTGKRIIVRTTAGENSVSIAVIDNGVGIPTENLTRIFAHGFTTRKHGHGFGLHSSALAAKDLGGSLIALSDGPGEGATFVLELPYAAGVQK